MLQVLLLALTLNSAAGTASSVDAANLATEPIWENYTIDGMNVSAVRGSQEYNKVVILLHCGGCDGSYWRSFWDKGTFGDATDMKYVFPRTVRDDHLWFQMYKKEGCRVQDDCTYNIDNIKDSASRIANLIRHEMHLVGGDNSKVYLGGFSQGSMMTSYMQLANLDFPLAGVILFDGFPIPPLNDMPNHSSKEAKKNATYYGKDMNWMIWHGSADYYFDANLTMGMYHDIFDLLGIRSAIKYEHVEPGQSHLLTEKGIKKMVEFIKGAKNSTQGQEQQIPEVIQMAKPQMDEETINFMQ